MDFDHCVNSLRSNLNNSQPDSCNKTGADCQRTQSNSSNQIEGNPSVHPSNNVPLTDTEISEMQKLKNMEETDVKELDFDSHIEAGEWFDKYASACGFDTRRNGFRRNKDGAIYRRTFLCSCEGWRKIKTGGSNQQREPRSDIRCGCNAKLVVKLDAAKSKWFVHEFRKAHTHELVEAPFQRFMKVNRNISKEAGSLIRSRLDAGMRPSEIMKLAVHEAGGHANVGFIDKDIYNFAYKRSTEQIIGGDAANALTYLQSRKGEDKEFFIQFTENEGKLLNLFWADSMSRADYACFGELLLFDTTYKKNHYNLPLVIFSGINHHFASCIFGSALLAKEDEASYLWVLKTLTTAMGNKTPKAVITDGDLAMLNAINIVFPDASHRLCSWHLSRNVVKKIKHNPTFTEGWIKFVHRNYPDVKRFDEEWKKFVDECGLTGNVWVKTQLTDRVGAWANSYLRETFFAGSTTTSRCEGINSKIGRHLKRKYNLFGFFTQFTRWTRELREKELKLDFNSSYGLPEIKFEAVKTLELSGARAFTRKLFFKFRKELGKSIGLTKSTCETTESVHEYKISQFTKPDRVWTTTYNVSEKSAKCSCKKFENMMIPCSHILFVLKEEHVEEVPNRFLKL
ncbi:Protein FAR1-RELATED SEQUENCE 5, partial [Linum grandiflorum]